MLLYWPKLEQNKINYNEKLPLKNSALIRAFGLNKFVGIEDGWSTNSWVLFKGFEEGWKVKTSMANINVFTKPNEDNEEGEEQRSSSRCTEERRLMKTMKNEYNSM